jgi:hypothetical protein
MKTKKYHTTRTVNNTTGLTTGSSRTHEGLQEHRRVFKNTEGSSRTQLGLHEHSRVFKNTAGSSRT